MIRTHRCYDLPVDDVAAPLLYSRGFAFAPTLIELLEELPHFRRISVPDGHLYVDEVVPLDLEIKGGSWAALIGTTIPLSSGRLSSSDDSLAGLLLDAAMASGTRAVEQDLYDLGGRYALLISARGEITVHHDACGTRSVYYDAEMNAISSHLDLLERCRKEAPATSSASLRLDLQWDRTRHPSIRALLANHRLELRSGRVTRYHLVQDNPARSLGHEERLALIEAAWAEQLEQIVSLDKPLVLSLTGGQDSRLMLAMSKEHRDRFESITYTTQEAIDGVEPKTTWERSMALDHAIVKKLSPFLPASHRFLPRGSEEGARWVATHRSVLDRNAEVVHGRWILPLYGASFPGRDAIHCRGNLLEIGRLLFAEPGDLSNPRDRVLTLLQRRAGKEAQAKRMATDLGRRAMDELTYAQIHPTYELTDVWYWEVRHSRWYAQLLSETDPIFESLSPFNVRRVMDAFLAYAAADRKRALAQSELTYRANPYLTFPAINEESDLYRKFVSDGRESTVSTTGSEA